MAGLIGHGRCPIGCGSTKARYSHSTKDLVVVTCNACNFQGFARSDRSDELLRANIAPEADPPPPPAATPAPPPAPTQAPKEKPGWGVLGGMKW